MNWPPKEICGYPISVGFIVTPGGRLGRKLVAHIGTRLSSRNCEKPEPSFIQEVPAEYMSPTCYAINGVGAQVTAEPREQAFLQHAGSEWIELPRIE